MAASKAASSSGASATAGTGGDPKLPGNDNGMLASFEDPSCVPLVSAGGAGGSR